MLGDCQRFWLFGGPGQLRRGGMNDLKGRFRNIEACHLVVMEKCQNWWWQIYDTTFDAIIESDDEIDPPAWR